METVESHDGIGRAGMIDDGRSEVNPSPDGLHFAINYVETVDTNLSAK